MLLSGVEAALGAGRIASAVVAVCSYTPARRDDRLDSPGHPEIAARLDGWDGGGVVPMGPRAGGARADSFYPASWSESSGAGEGRSLTSRRLNLHKFSIKSDILHYKDSSYP